MLRIQVNKWKREWIIRLLHTHKKFFSYEFKRKKICVFFPRRKMMSLLPGEEEEEHNKQQQQQQLLLLLNSFKWQHPVDTCLNLIQIYMRTEYPAADVWNLFTYFGSIAANREFALFRAKKKKADEEISDYVSRHESFPTLALFYDVLHNTSPYRIEIGPIRIKPPSKGESLPYIVASEFRLDIDIDLYDGKDPHWPICSRSCCRGKDFCPSCWPLVTIAANQINIALRAIGSTDHAWFYTGGRGLHCWVFSASNFLFKEPSKFMRTKLLNFLCGREEEEGRECNAIVSAAAGSSHDILSLRKIQSLLIDDHAFTNWFMLRHPYIALQTIDECAKKMLTNNADILTVNEKEDISRVIFHEKILNAAKSVECVRLLKLREVRKHEEDVTIADLPSIEEGGGGGEEEVSCICLAIAQVNKLIVQFLKEQQFAIIVSKDWSKSAIAVIAEAAICCMGPRVDFQVTEQAGHLLRSPMGVHLATGRLGILVCTGTSDPLLLRSFYPKDGVTVPILVRSGNDNSVYLHPPDLTKKCMKDFHDWVTEQKNHL